MIKYRQLIVFTSAVLLFACKPEAPVDPNQPSAVVTIKKDSFVEDQFLGNGVQWGGYDLLPEWTGEAFFSPQDWDKLRERVSYLKPGLVRIMIAAGWNYLGEGSYDPLYKPERILPILEFCQQENITVMFGEWGHEYLDGNYQHIDHNWVGHAAEYLRWLIQDKGFSCIKYYNMVNEPNGDWSSIRGDYELWKSLIREFSDSLENKGISDLIQIAGPDIAVWSSEHRNWIFDTDLDLNEEVALFDIHTYPGQKAVRDGDYRTLLTTYKDASPSGKQLIIGEIGIKYKAEDGSIFAEEAERKEEDPYSSGDGNMMIYDAFYGIDMADAIIQSMLAGYAGAIVWDMDDAMYNNPDYGNNDPYDILNLKRWGLWNILGDELFQDGLYGSKDEEIRPWFYPLSLLCRYFPPGSKIYELDLPNKKGLRVVACAYEDKYSLAIVNSNFVEYEKIQIKFDGEVMFEQMDRFDFVSGKGSDFIGSTDEKGFPVPAENGIDLDMQKGLMLDAAPQSFTLYTNISY